MTEHKQPSAICLGVFGATIAWNEPLSHFPALQIFVDNFVHADLHPGNILVQGRALPERAAAVDVCDTLVLEVQPAPPELRLVLLDAGIVAELQSADMCNFRAVFTAVVQGQVMASRAWGWQAEPGEGMWL